MPQRRASVSPIAGGSGERSPRRVKFSEVKSEISPESSPREDESSSSSEDELAEEEEEELEEDEDTIDGHISETAARNNLSRNTVKDIIKQLVSNDQVIAICKLRAEEIERHIEEEKRNFTKQLLDDTPDGVKLTRNKAKELNHSITNQIPSLDLRTVSPDEEVAQLINKDLPEEEDDDEYNPDDDDECHSDDYSTATCSDIESQPRTPGDTLIADADESPNKSDPDVQYDNEGVFKVPGEPRTPNRATREEPVAVAKRTRSKVSLTTTTIETIQETFVPPDIIPDLFDANETEEVDEPWQEFLEQFQRPLDVAGKEDEEDANDPEYVATNSRTLVDNVNFTVSKKEVQVLIDELLEGFEESFNPDFANELEIEALKASFAHQSTSSAVAALPGNDCETSVNETAREFNDSLAFSHNNSGFDFPGPSPAKENLQESFQQSAMDVQNDSCVFVEPLAILNAQPTFSSDYDMVLGTDNKLYLLAKESAIQPSVEVEEQSLMDDYPIDGWTRKSLRALHKQLLIHIQVAGQLFIQTYSHPIFWKEAKYYKEMLQELSNQTSKESQPFLSSLAWNLKDMLEICLKWETELNVENEENEQFVKDLLPYPDRWKQYHRFFHYRVAEQFVSHRAFIFASYLPTRVAGCNGDPLFRRMTGGEMKLFALSIHEANGGKLVRGQPYRERAVHYFRKKYSQSRSAELLNNFMSKHAKLSQRDNPIQAYVKRGELPVTEAEELDINCYEDVVPHAEKPIYSLPPKWNSYVFSKERASKVLNPGDDTIYKRKGESLSNKKRKLEERKEVEDIENCVEVENSIPKKKKSTKIETVSRSTKKVKKIRVDRAEIEALKRLIDRVRKTECRSKDLEKVRLRKLVTKKLHKSLQQLDEEYDKNVEPLGECSISKKIFHYIKEFDIFARLLFGRMSNSAMMDQQVNWEERQRDNLRNRTRIGRSSESETHQRDSMFAWRFVTAVERVFRKRKDQRKFTNFLKLLKQNRGSIPDLFLNLEEFFLPQHPELVELLLLHLLPGHATQVGKFFHRRLSLSSRTLKRDLKVFMDRRESQLEEIYALLLELGQEEATSMAEIRHRFLLVLQSNPLITAWFLQLFPNQNYEDREEEVDSFNNSNIESRIVIPAYLLSTRSSSTTEDNLESSAEKGDRNHAKRRCNSPAPYSSPMKDPCLDNSWSRDDDRLIFDTMNGVKNCPEKIILQTLFEAFPRRSQVEVEQRFRTIVELLNTLS